MQGSWESLILSPWGQMSKLIITHSATIPITIATSINIQNPPHSKPENIFSKFTLHSHQRIHLGTLPQRNPCKPHNQQLYHDMTTQGCYIGLSDQTDFEAVSPEGGGHEQLNFRLMNKLAHQYYCNGILLCKHPCRAHPTAVNHLTI